MKKKKGFTLVEMVLTIAIIVVLSGALTTALASYITKANTASAAVDSHQNKYAAAKTQVDALRGGGGGGAPGAPVTDYTVTFKGKDGASTLATVTVTSGGAATAPTAPPVTGFTYTGWDKDFSNVTANLTVTALYSSNAATQYNVIFKGKDGATLKTQVVTSGGGASAPTAPVVTGFTFTGWDKTFSNVTSDLTVTALYSANAVTQYTVTFKDKDDKLISTVTVASGGSATAPTPPTVSGFVFDKWDKAFSNVTANLTVKALYLQSYTVTFKGKDGATTLSTVTVGKGKAATAPAAPDISGFTFSGWDKDFSNITANLTVKALYTAVPTSVPNTTVTPKDISGWNNPNANYILSFTGSAITDGSFPKYITISFPAGTTFTSEGWNATLMSSTSTTAVIKIDGNWDNALYSLYSNTGVGILITKVSYNP